VHVNNHGARTLVITQEDLEALHLPALQMLLALTGAGERLGNVDVQNFIFNRLCKHETELCVSTMRDRLIGSIKGLKMKGERAFRCQIRTVYV
jgi:hypothetical protein